MIRYEVWHGTTHGKQRLGVYSSRCRARLAAWAHRIQLPRDSMFRPTEIRSESRSMASETPDGEPN